MTRRRITAALPALALAALLAAGGPAAAAEHGTGTGTGSSTGRPQAVAVQRAADVVAPQAAPRITHAPATAVTDLAAGDKEKKKGGFFKKLGIAVLIVILLIVLLVIGLVVAVVLGIRALFRRRSA
ncbi:hypothetical protein HUT16_03085 [Kitasatospora sp. NA04385]|uniref:hypothetical protein n=1 Tax=Kitasatospora sp. NA04385 TaxID=2742135 RepID=UPI00158FBC2C|nr:hypothetical protein [Kitasatospora sp. NA04385]QKW18180.1 hypothetical protein HUT16_03085 [Kitasatospora sp. NA04385]